MGSHGANIERQALCAFPHNNNGITCVCAQVNIRYDAG